ncbi:MAG: DUF4357 domain-containing protein [Lachnospiraceae bacterium]|nr:DUF4357 domain-containing protein [Lachnospiraceae bacterium]
MSRGVIYVMSTVVSGLVKIGKTRVDNFEQRMYNLERNGYANVVGLKRQFAIEVDDYDDKEALIDEIFSKSRVPNTELFALDIDLVKQLLASFDGKQIYPPQTSKKEVFKEASAEYNDSKGWSEVPDGTYYLNRNIKGFGKVEGKMKVEEGMLIVLKGSKCAPLKRRDKVPSNRTNAIIENDILLEDMPCKSPSVAAFVVVGNSCNGWIEWKNSKGESIDKYRNK